MNFFEPQDVARRKTGRMVVYFCLAVILIIVAVYLATAFAASAIQWGHEPLEEPTFNIWDPELAAGVTVVMLLVIAFGSLYKISLLSGGGAAVAEALGGRRIERGTGDLDQQIVLNVVAEMAIAAGTPVPPVYLLADEEGINAFAA